MHLAIVSDIHANLPALESVLAEIEHVGVDEIWSLGDVVGYGAHPNECSALVQERCAVSLAGNHDLAVLGALDVTTFSPAAAEAARWTDGVLSNDSRDFLAKLKPADESREEVAIYHASPRDHVWEYVLWTEQAGECLAEQAARVSLIGHSHVALSFHAEEGDDPEATDGAPERAGAELDLSSSRWLINPGSVGQPRDGDARAAWMELDTTTWSARYHRTDYDIDRAADAIAAADLPEHLGRRLYLGQ